MSINIDELGPVDWIVVEFPDRSSPARSPRSSKTWSTAS